MQLEELDVQLGQGRTMKDPRSKLMQAKAKAQKGQKINVCPFGCLEKNLDHNSYCKHLIGFTRDKIHYEPMVLRKGRRVIQVRQVPTGEMEQGDDGNMIPITEPEMDLVQEGDKICRVSDCFRVYRKDPPATPLPPAKDNLRRKKESVA